MYCAWRIPAHLRCTQCSILLHLMDICFLTCICLWQISQIQTFSRHLPTDCQKDEKLFRATLLKAASHHIPTGRRKLYTQQVPADILTMMEERDDLRKQDPASPRLPTMNDEITKVTSDHKRRQWREFVESIDHRTDSTKLWRTIKGIDGKSKQTAENEGITFTGRHHTSPKMIANSFNRQFTTSKLGQALFIKKDSSGVEGCKNGCL